MKKTYKSPVTLVVSLTTEGMIAVSMGINTQKGGSQQLSNKRDWSERNSIWGPEDEE